MSKIYIGIDPDVHKSGFAVVTNGVLTEFSAESFFSITEKILSFHYDNDVTVIIEAGWLNIKSNWHKSQTVATAQRIAKNVGSNHQTGKLFAQFCEYNQISYQLVRPKQSKTTPKMCSAIIGETVKNQDIVDAIMLVQRYIRGEANAMDK